MDDTLDKAWVITMAILCAIATILVGWSMFEFSKPHKVDCENYMTSETDYKPLPKQCEEGE